MSVIDRHPWLLLVCALFLGACTTSPPGPASPSASATVPTPSRTPVPDGALTVNGEPVARPLYDLLVRSAQLKVERAGIPVQWNSPDGARRLTGLQVQAIKNLVRNAVVEQLARQRQISVSTTDLDAALAQIEEVLGGPAVLDQQLEQQGLSRDDYRALFRYTLLERKLDQADPAQTAAPAIDQAMQTARVQVYVGPCATNHQYPQCVELPA